MRLSWPETSGPPELTIEEVHVWSTPLDDLRTSWSNLLTVLAPDERERAERFRVDAARRRFVVARSALRKLLGLYLRTPPDEVGFDYDTTGKPRLRPSGRLPDLQFNLAHSGELALLAVARGCEVGIDVERLRQVHHWREIAERYFHLDEDAEIRALPEAEQLAAFMRCWTGKEAVLKAIGTGVTRPLDFFVGNAFVEQGDWIEVPAAGGNVVRCDLHSLIPSADYIGAVACLEARRRPRCFALV